MNSVHLFVKDATGRQYLDTFAANTPAEIGGFRAHVSQWKRYVRTPAGQRAYRGSLKGAPCFPITIHVEPYEDGSQK